MSDSLDPLAKLSLLNSLNGYGSTVPSNYQSDLPSGLPAPPGGYTSGTSGYDNFTIPAPPSDVATAAGVSGSGTASSTTGSTASAEDATATGIFSSAENAIQSFVKEGVIVALGAVLLILGLVLAFWKESK